MKKGVRRYRKRSDSAANARPKVKYVGAAGRSLLRSDPLDRRTVVGRRYYETLDAMRAHLGGNISLPEEQLVEQVARLSLVCAVSWEEMLRNGMLNKGEITASFDVWLKAARDQRSVLQMLGLKRRKQPVKDLSEYIAEQGQSK